jgi:aspartate 1-decarboxylase
MQIHVLKSKIHRARVTDSSLDYQGSLTIPADLMEQVGLHPFERILVGNMANGARFETYAIPGPAQSRRFALNGATARLGQPGDPLTIMSFALINANDAAGWKPRIIVLDETNHVKKPSDS